MSKENKNLDKTDNSALNMAMLWWESLDDDERIEAYKKTGNFRLGGWGHDIGPTEEDVFDMYKVVFNYC